MSEAYTNLILNDTTYGVNNLFNIDKWIKPMTNGDPKSLDTLAFESEIRSYFGFNLTTYNNLT